MEDWPEFIKNHFATVPFFQFMNVTVLHTSRGQAKLKIPMKPQYANTYGIAHGGIVAALVDMASGVALRTLKVRIVTVETSTTYFTPGSLHDELIAEAQLAHEGRRLLHADVNVFNSEGILIAKGKAIYYVLGEDTGEYSTVEDCAITARQRADQLVEKPIS